MTIRITRIYPTMGFNPLFLMAGWQGLAHAPPYTLPGYISPVPFGVALRHQLVLSDEHRSAGKAGEESASPTERCLSGWPGACPDHLKEPGNSLVIIQSYGYSRKPLEFRHGSPLHNRFQLVDAFNR
jgi:hypothetical protein